MIIKNITIENFRSYYGSNSIDFGEKLTLVIGANGDGKTTFFEALEWLFDTVGALPITDTKYISKKKISELLPNESAYVKAIMTYISDGSERIVQKSFKFAISLSGEISISNYSHQLYIQNGVEKEVIEGERVKKIFDADFAAPIRKYCLFKGEEELNIFNKKEAMSFLVETFSQIRDFDPYVHFMQESKKWAETATDNAMKSDRKNSREAETLRAHIKSEEQKIGELESERRNKDREATNFKKLLEDIEKNKDSSALLNSTNERLRSLIEERNNLGSHIKENYTFRLLDEMWILMGFSPIAEEYKKLVAHIDKEQRRQQSQYDQELGAKKLAEQLQREIDLGQIPLALNIPDENTMREMLDDEICKVCGREAKKGSEAYNYMKMRLNNFLDSQKVAEQKEEEPRLFKYEFIRELSNRYSVLLNNMNFIQKLNSFIDGAIATNIDIHRKIDRINNNILEEEDRKKKILAQTDGLTEDQLLSEYENISRWWSGRNDAEKSIEHLQIQIDSHKNLLSGYREQYSKISKESSAAMYERSSEAIRKILNAFTGAKQKNKQDFLLQLEKEANFYLELLNKSDFRGYARIEELPDNSAQIVLIDNDGTRIYNPNTALKTTMYMSLLFAISKLTSIKHENDFPLIFDAPTSSFTTSKERDFFNVIGNIQKQTIIFSKSFLIEDNGTLTLDDVRLRDINAKKYRIKKKEPFNEKELSTIHTIIESI